AGIDAVAVVGAVHALERAVDLADQLAVTVAGTQFQRVLGLARRTLGLVADVTHFVLEVLDGLLGFLDQVRAPLQQALAEVLELQRAHVLLVGTRAIAVGHDRAAGDLVGLVLHDLVPGPGRRRGRPGHHGHGDLADRTRRERRARRRLRRFLPRRLRRCRALGGRSRLLDLLRDRRGLGDGLD